MSRPWQGSSLRREPVVVLLALLVAGGLSGVDYLSGHQVSISAFYLMPIGWACWVTGRRAGIIVALVTAVMWLIADMPSAHEYGHPAIPFWNALMLLALFIVVVYLLSGFQAAHRYLEATVRKRTAALEAEIAERKRLETAKLQAERLAALGKMAAELAHEVRNPLGSIALNLDLAQREIEKMADHSGHTSGEGLLLVGEIRAELHRIQQVLENYLQFARLPKAQRRAVVLSDWLEQKLGFMSGTFEQKGVTLCTRFGEPMPPVLVDPEQLWQAMLNLIRNAMESMMQGGELTVGTSHDGSVCRIWVKDSGMGMTSEQIGNVFMPFFSTKQEGTGLGLVLVQQIALDHGGHVECESKVGKGSTFTIVLPVEPSA